MSYVENGVRKIVPYYQTFKTHIKSRWEGRTIVEVFSKELGQNETVTKQEILNHDIFLYENYGTKKRNEIKGDRLLVRPIAKNDVIINRRHVHEPGVIWKSDIEIIHLDENVLVVNKPSGIPTHPTSSYYKNSVSEILKETLQIENVWTAHRLDKVTSGILLLGLNKSSGIKLASIIEKKLDFTSKTYLARVGGMFPETFTYTAPVFLVNVSGGYIMPPSLKVASNSTTKFRRIRYNEDLDESIVECIPISGKMHQIRIHLRNIGFPILNDFIYNDKMALRHVNAIKNKLELKLYQRLPATNEPIVDLQSIVDDGIREELSEIKNLNREKLDKVKTGENCPDCGRQLFGEINQETASIWLHSYRYRYDNPEDEFSFDYKTSLPEWCNI